MKPLNINKRAAVSRDMAMKEEALAILEGMRQEANAGVYDPALAERNRRLIMGTIDDTPVAPYNTVKGNQIEGLGIAGQFQPDSDVRIHTEYGNTGDPLLDRSVAQYGLRELGINTEYLTRSGEAALYKLWKAEQEADSYKRYQNKPEQFNRALQEYYGQQALKLAGNTPVSDRDRSYNVRDGRYRDRRTGRLVDPGNRNHPNSTLGTDRLIETNASILGGDVGRPAGDYRYITPEGQLKIGDYQGADYTDPNRRMDALIRLQMLKGSKMSPTQRQGFAENLRAAAANVSDIDDALEIMHQKGELPELVMEEIKQDKPSYTGRTSGMRAGKMMSDARFMGDLNRNDQHRYSHVLYGLQGKGDLEVLGEGGGVPQAYFNVPTSAAREYMANNTNNIRMGLDGSAFMAPTIGQLLNAGVATDLVSAYPTVSQLLVQR